MNFILYFSNASMIFYKFWKIYTILWNFYRLKAFGKEKKIEGIVLGHLFGPGHRSASSAYKPTARPAWALTRSTRRGGATGDDSLVALVG
jgi:hypothetical protein